VLTKITDSQMTLKTRSHPDARLGIYDIAMGATAWGIRLNGNLKSWGREIPIAVLPTSLMI
jgi:hypothetical protein